MSLLAGKNGKVIFDANGDDTTIAYVTAFSIDATQSVTESSNLSTTTWKTFVGNKIDWTAKVSCYLSTTGLDVWGEAAVGEELGQDVKLEFWFDTTAAGSLIRVLYGSGFVKGMTITDAKDATVTLELDIQGNGVLAWAEAEPTYA